MSFANVNPSSAHATERNRLGAKKEQCGPGLSRWQHVPPSNHSSSRSVGRRFMSAAARNAAGLLRQATVYGMLDSVGGRPEGGWKMWPAACCRQNAPARFARIFRVCHISAIKRGPSTRRGTARVPLSQLHTLCARAGTPGDSQPLTAYCLNTPLLLPTHPSVNH
jgi:hypothetical protein